ncbi:uncharacterized protein LOC108744182 isoform X2 [Agrilus planipennis]|uniref:Uncharacterized protein LOC108744182 isoform X2 n=1 Tax=Agrilus planipennis TaxID=224129 RepID=A0A7F5R9A1_AGRPL|nr:uncharacterized protein LOC108744182 isoform X2 [Agrilus planipennis]
MFAGTVFCWAFAIGVCITHRYYGAAALQGHDVGSIAIKVRTVDDGAPIITPSKTKTKPVSKTTERKTDKNKSKRSLIAEKPVFKTIESKTAKNKTKRSLILEKPVSNTTERKTVKSKTKRSLILEKPVSNTTERKTAKSKTKRSLILELFKKEFIHCINGFRILHGVQPLKQSNTISNFSQEHANKILETGKIEGSHSKYYGESIGYFDINLLLLNDAYGICTYWYSDYGFRNYRGTNGTQMIWKETTHLGIGVSEDVAGFFVVVNYYPKGNIKGDYYVNVPRRLKQISDEDVCRLPRERGVCQAMIPRFYYDGSSGTCRFFIYGGCGGNNNNFETLHSCTLKCVNSKLAASISEDSDEVPKDIRKI